MLRIKNSSENKMFTLKLVYLFTILISRWVIENILAVGRHFQTTSYITEDGPRELDDTIEVLVFTIHSNVKVKTMIL